LLDAGILEAVQLRNGAVGRPAVMLRLSPELGYVVGLDIGASNTRVLVTNIGGEILFRCSHKSKTYSDNHQFVQEITGLANAAVEQSGVDPARILGLGVAISGVVDSLRGHCFFCPNIPGVRDLALKQVLQAQFPHPVFVADQSHTYALAEKRFGAARGVDNFLLVTVGIGVGSAICIEGRIYRGEMGLTPELGHITVSEDGPLCSCGNYGCLEAMASGPAIVQRVRQALQEGLYSSLGTLPADEITVETIAEAARAGDKLAFSVIDRTGQYIGIAIATALNLLGPQLVIVGGGVANCGELLLDAIERTAKIHALHVISPHVRVVRSTLDEYGAAWGAALSVIEVDLSASLGKVALPARVGL